MTNILLMMGPQDGGGGIGSFLPLILIVVIISVIVVALSSYKNRKSSNDEATFHQDIQNGMVINRYYEYRKWAFFWGFFLDSKKEVQQVLNQYNADGWKVVQFEYNSPKYNIFRTIFIYLISFITLGFVSYWEGFSVIFEKTSIK